MGEGVTMEYIKAFVVGGLICMLVQILMEKTKMMPGRIMVGLVVIGTLLGDSLAFMSRLQSGRGPERRFRF